MELVEILKEVADETRLRILNLLKGEELCVCEIEKLLNLTQSNASRHLTRLSRSKMVTGTKKQQYVYYRFNEEILNKYPFLKELLFHETEKVKKLKEEYENLLKFKAQGKGCDNLD